MYKVVGFRNGLSNYIGVFYCKNRESCEEIIKEYDISNGIILDDTNACIGVLFSKTNNSNIGLSGKENISPFEWGIKDYISNSKYQIYGILDEEQSFPLYKSLNTLDEVHEFLHDKDILFGFILENGELEFLIDEGALLDKEHY